jgi:glucuronokinase
MPEKIVKRGYARLGLMGNPGDALGGAAVTCTISELWAQVTLTADTEIRFIEPEIEIPRWDSIDTFREYLVQRGHNGGRRLMSAIFSRFIKYCHSRNLPLSNQTFALSWESSIPNRVGLAGSSALITATLRCLMEFYQIQIPKLDQVEMVLKTETDELGIPAGPMDRVAQVYEGLNYFEPATDAFLHVESLNPDTLPPLYVAINEHAGEGTEVFHSDLKTRFRNKEPQVLDGLVELSELARQCRDLLKTGQGTKIGPLMNRNFAIRQSLTNLNPDHVRMIETARAAGAAAKYAGSGGAIVGTCPPDQMEKVIHALQKQGYRAFQPVIKRSVSHD